LTLGAIVHRPYDTEPHPLVRKLDGIVNEMTSEERDAVRALPMMVRELNPDQDIVRDGDRPSQCCLVLEGVAFRYKMLGDGRRQIYSFHITGDIPDLQSLHLDVMDHSLSVATRSKVGFIQHHHLHEFNAHWPRLAGALWRDTLIDGAIFRQWMLGIGRKQALGRIAHLLCELFAKMKAVGLATDHSIPMPITQEEFADALGLSGVHVNRSLQELRSRDLINLERRTLTILEWNGLKEVADFDPTYLHQKPRQAA
jgi:CRP-like cAMP-binding protein